jgi:hypothetical protein
MKVVIEKINLEPEQLKTSLTLVGPEIIMKEEKQEDFLIESRKHKATALKSFDRKFNSFS